MFQEEQEKMHRELMNYRENFSTHMGKVHTAQEENKAKLNQINQVVLRHSLDSQAGNMYTHFGLQQCFPSLVPVTPSKIPRAIGNNFRAGKPLFEGMLRPWPPEGSTSAAENEEKRAKRLKKLAEEKAEQNWTHRVTFGQYSKCEPNVTHPRTSPTSLKQQQASFGPRLNVGQTCFNKASTHQTTCTLALALPRFPSSA
ncbi:hypothetical protein PIB30_080112 [Stylosanthes scabra]|uniref:Uncharacterized protein n=1 Tax=Stylosanthes scabra TaxID=79078 RepID=A0ABU6XPD5_9FABA|nr:hypothetical protein [Stylosanthes scabra]